MSPWSKSSDDRIPTVHCFPRIIDRCCALSEVANLRSGFPIFFSRREEKGTPDRRLGGGLMLSLESQCVFQNLLLFCFAITNHLMTGSLARGKIHCSPREQS